MHESQRQGGRGASGSRGPRRANFTLRASMPARVRGVFLAISALGMLGPLEPEAYAQAGAGGAGGAPAGGEKSGTGGAAASEKKAAAETKIAIFVEGAQAGEVRAEIEKSLP